MRRIVTDYGLVHVAIFIVDCAIRGSECLDGETAEFVCTQYYVEDLQSPCLNSGQLGQYYRVRCLYCSRIMNRIAGAYGRIAVKISLIH